MGLLIHTQQGALYANKEAARVLGSGQNDMIGRHFLDFLETSVEDAREQMEAAFAGGGEVKTTEATLKASDGSLRTIQIIAEDSPGLEIAAAVIFNMFREGYQTKPALVRALQRHKGLKELTSTSSSSIAVSGTKHGYQRRSIE